jgi:hypothetical protein
MVASRHHHLVAGRVFFPLPNGTRGVYGRMEGIAIRDPAGIQLVFSAETQYVPPAADASVDDVCIYSNS